MCQQFEAVLFAPILLALPTFLAIIKAAHAACWPRRGGVTFGMEVDIRRQLMRQWGGMIQCRLAVLLAWSGALALIL
jgi:hypothetical protein